MSRKVAIIFATHLLVIREKIGTIIIGKLKRMNQIATGRLNHNRIHWMFSPVQFITLHKLKKKKKMGYHGE